MSRFICREGRVGVPAHGDEDWLAEGKGFELSVPRVQQWLSTLKYLDKFDLVDEINSDSAAICFFFFIPQAPAPLPSGYGQ